MKNKVYVAGLGPGAPEYLLPVALKVITDCDVLIGGKRNLDLFRSLNKEQITIGSDLTAVSDYIASNIGKKSMAVLVTGDPGLYSMLSFLKRVVDEDWIEVMPGISSLQYFFMKLKTTWEDIHIASLHGREIPDLAGLLAGTKRVALLTDRECTPKWIAEFILKNSLDAKKIWVGERLSYPDERITAGTPAEIASMEFDSLSVVLVEEIETEMGVHRADTGLKGESGQVQCEGTIGENFGPGVCEQATVTGRKVNGAGANSVQELWPYRTPGAPDKLFIRGEVPMTKEEVRAVSIAKLRLTGRDTVYDIGAGTGSVAVECALLSPGGRVFAVEREEEGVKLIRQNRDRFGVKNMEILHGEAPAALDSLPVPDRVFIGGAGGSLDRILDAIVHKTEGSVKAEGNLRIVVNCITLETLHEAVEYFARNGFGGMDIANIQVSRAKKAGRYNMMMANNPVFIVTAEKERKA